MKPTLTDAMNRELGELSEFFLCKDIHNRVVVRKNPENYSDNGRYHQIPERDLGRVREIVKNSRYTKQAVRLMDLYGEYQERFFQSKIKVVKKETGKTLDEWADVIHNHLEEMPEEINPNMPAYISQKEGLSYEWGQILWQHYGPPG